MKNCCTPRIASAESLDKQRVYRVGTRMEGRQFAESCRTVGCTGIAAADIVRGYTRHGRWCPTDGGVDSPRVEQFECCFGMGEKSLWPLAVVWGHNEQGCSHMRCSLQLLRLGLRSG
jgi:hypothetical protein